MRISLISSRLCFAIIVAIGTVSGAGAANAPVMLSCDDGTKLLVAYSLDRSSVVIGGNEAVRLVQVKAASGVRYVGETGEYWEKGRKVRWTANGKSTKNCTLPGAPRSGDPKRIANPASVYCADIGGRPLTEKLPNGSEFGVCLFEDNRQCGQWALFRGECPVGGLRVAGYPTDAARYCAIAGGRYEVSGTKEICTTQKGTVCDVEAHYRGDCR